MILRSQIFPENRSKHFPLQEGNGRRLHVGCVATVKARIIASCMNGGSCELPAERRAERRNGGVRGRAALLNSLTRFQVLALCLL